MMVEACQGSRVRGYDGAGDLLMMMEDLQVVVSSQPEPSVQNIYNK